MGFNFLIFSKFIMTYLFIISVSKYWAKRHMYLTKRLFKEVIIKIFKQPKIEKCLVNFEVFNLIDFL